MASKAAIIRSLYFYVISTVGLLMVVFSVADLVNLGLKTWVFPEAEPTYIVCPADYRVAPAPVEESGPTFSPEEQQKECEAQRGRAREDQIRNRQSNAIRDISFLVVGIPLFWFHFRTVQRERREERDNNS